MFFFKNLIFKLLKMTLYTFKFVRLRTKSWCAENGKMYAQICNFDKEKRSIEPYLCSVR